MDEYIDVVQCFKEDDFESVWDYIKGQNPMPVLVAAAAYSKGQQCLSACMTRIILDEVIEWGYMHHAICLFDELINASSTIAINGSVIQMVQNDTTIQLEENASNTRPAHQEFLMYIGTCSEPEFDQLLAFISNTEAIITMLPSDTLLVIAERIRRRLDDDRVFFLTMYSAFLIGALEQVTAAFQELEELEYFEEDFEDPFEAIYFSDHGQVNSCSGVNWVSEHPRKNNRRRRR